MTEITILRRPRWRQVDASRYAYPSHVGQDWYAWISRTGLDIALRGWWLQQRRRDMGQY